MKSNLHRQLNTEMAKDEGFQAVPLQIPIVFLFRLNFITTQRRNEITKKKGQIATKVNDFVQNEREGSRNQNGRVPRVLIPVQPLRFEPIQFLMLKKRFAKQSMSKKLRKAARKNQFNKKGTKHEQRPERSEFSRGSKTRKPKKARESEPIQQKFN